MPAGRYVDHVSIVRGDEDYQQDESSELEAVLPTLGKFRRPVQPLCNMLLQRDALRHIPATMVAVQPESLELSAISSPSLCRILPRPAAS